MSNFPSVLDIIKRHKLSPNKAAGQHYLFDNDLLERISCVHGCLSGKEILEVGFGPGGLTMALLKNASSRVHAVDKDYRFICAAKDWGLIYGDRLKVYEKDILNFSFFDFFSSIDTQSNRPLLFSNLPYNITSNFLLKLFGVNRDFPEDRCIASFFSCITLLLQKEVALRLSANCGSRSFNRLALLCSLSSNLEFHFEISAENFLPPPSVSSYLISFYPSREHTALRLSTIERLSLSAFKWRRKKIRHSLRSVLGDDVSLLGELGIDWNYRAEDLSKDDFIRLADFVNNKR